MLGRIIRPTGYHCSVNEALHEATTKQFFMFLFTILSKLRNCGVFVDLTDGPAHTLRYIYYLNSYKGNSTNNHPCLLHAASS